MDLKLVFQKSLSSDKNLRQEAEATLDSMAQQNLPEFLGCLSVVVADQVADAAVRQAAAVQLKNRVSYNKPVRNALLNEEWLKCDENVKARVRQNLLEGFTATQDIVRAGAANAVAAVASIDLRNEQWGDLANVFGGVLNNPGVEMGTKEAILRCVHYIGENLEDQDVPAVVGRMLVELSVTGLGIQHLGCAIQAALALASAIPLASELFESEGACGNLITQIRSSWEAIPDEEFRFAIFSSALPLVQYGYETIGPHMDFLLNISLETIAKKGKSAYPALAFWSSLAECEAELEDASRNLVNTHLNKLVESVFNLAIEMNEDEDSEEPYESESLGMMAMSTIMTLAHNTNENSNMLNFLVQFYNMHHSNPDRRFRDLAFFCLALSFVQAPNVKESTQWIKEQLERLVIAAKTDPSHAVRDTCMFAVRNLFDNKSSIALDQAIFQVLLDLVVDRLKNDEALRVVKQAAPALFVIHQTLVECEKLHLYIQTAHSKMVAESLYTKGNQAFKEGYPEIGTSCYETLDEWIKHVDSPSLIAFAEILFKALAETVTNTATNVEVVEAIQDSHLASLANIVMVLKTDLKAIAGPLINVAMQIITHRTTNKKPIPPQAIDLFNWLISRMKEQFREFAPIIFDAIKFALEDADNHRTCTRATSCMCLLAMRFPDFVRPRATEIIMTVGRHFENPYVETRLRGEVIALMSNIAAMEDDDRNLPIVIAALKKTAESIISPDADEELLRDADQMYSEVCEAYSRLLLSKQHRLENYLEASSLVIKRFYERCLHQAHIPYSSYLAECLRMINDLLIIYKSQYKQLLETQLGQEVNVIRSTMLEKAPANPSQSNDEAIGNATMVGVAFLNAYKQIQ